MIQGGNCAAAKQAKSASRGLDERMLTLFLILRRGKFKSVIWRDAGGVSPRLGSARASRAAVDASSTAPCAPPRKVNGEGKVEVLVQLSVATLFLALP
jgi:hypothetical protein